MRLLDRLVDSLRWDEDRVSDRWLAEERRKSSRVEFHGVSWKFPVNKLANDAKFWTRRRKAA